MRFNLSVFLAVAAMVLPALNLPAQGAPTPTFRAIQQGQVRSEAAPVPFAHVTLYRAGDTAASGAVALGSAMADADGQFEIRYMRVHDPEAVLYLIADGVEPGTRLATVLGTAPLTKYVTINERTTVATANAMAQFIDGTTIGGHWPGLQNAARTLRNLVDLTTGDIGPVLGNQYNGTATSTMPAFNALSNLLVGAVRGLTAQALFNLATPPGGEAPTDTLQAAVNIAHFSWNNEAELFLLSLTQAPYQPALTQPPVTWTLALKYVGNGMEFDGPGNAAIDERGDVWVVNNYVYREDISLPTCGGREVIKLTATGEDFPGAPYPGHMAGVDGAGFGVTLGQDGSVWVGNFGFFGSTCPCELAPLANSVSQLTALGAPISPPTGYTQGCISGAQGMATDLEGSIWIANNCNGTVTKYIGGDPDNHWVYGIEADRLLGDNECPMDGLARAFDVAVDSHNNGWFTDNENNAAIRVSSDGVRNAYVSAADGISAPMGIAVDSQDNAWVSNSAIVHVPCATCILGETFDYGDLTPDLDNASVAKIGADGQIIGTYNGGGLLIPWGIAVDGDDNVWVANFGGFRVSAFHGDTGAPIAPHGFHSDALVRNTSVTIDPSGNVWLANNWNTVPIQTNPGGDGMVVFIGIASPVKTPLIGPVRRPDGERCVADLNHDGVVDAADLNTMLDTWGRPGPGDMNRDGVVDHADLNRLLGDLGPCS